MFFILQIHKFKLSASIIFFLSLFSQRGFSFTKSSFFNLNDSYNYSNAVGFTENGGQYPSEINLPKILFKAEIQGADIYVTENGLSYFFINTLKSKTSVGKDALQYEYSRFDICLKDASIIKDSVVKEQPSVEHYNFFYGHCPEGIMAVKQYKKITVKSVYPGIDWVLYGTLEKGLKYDFIVHPNADISRISLLFKSLYPLLLKDDNLELSFSSGKFIENKPVSFTKDTKTLVESKFELKHQVKKHFTDIDVYETEITFDIGTYNKNEDLIIDPLQLWWGTYYGGTKRSEGVSVTTDPAGNVVVLGNTDSRDFPVQSYGSLAYFQGTYGGANNSGGLGDLFILKFTNTGVLLWATYFGGSNAEEGCDIECDKWGNIFVLGESTSINFPLKDPGNGAYYDALNGISDWQYDFVIAKFSSAGTYMWGTYYGGNSIEIAETMCIDNNGDIYCVGSSLSDNFPCFNPGGGAFFQGTIWPFAQDDAVIIKFSNSGQRLYASYFGGNGADKINSVCTDSLGNVYFAGYTVSSNLYTQNSGFGSYFQNSIQATGTGNSNGFILKLNSVCQPLWSTYLGGNASDVINSAVCDKLGNLFLTANVNSSNFPTINPGNGAFYLPNNGSAHVAICKFNPQSQLLWSTYFGTIGVPSSVGNLSLGKCDEIYLTTACKPTSTMALMPIKNPGNGVYYDSTYNNDLNGSHLDIFIAAFSNTGVLRWGTFFGGVGDEATMITTTDKNGNIFYTGQQGSRYYTNTTSYASYTSKCILNPGNGAYFQPLPLHPTPSLTATPMGISPYCVIGKFSSPFHNSTYSSTGCGSTNSASLVPFGGWGPYNFNWSTGSQFDSIANVASGIYSYTITDSFFGCKTVDSVYLGVPSLTLNISSSNSAICVGQSAILSAIGANSFSWSPPQGLSATLGNSVSASPFTTTNYTITGFNSQNCKSDTIITLKVNELPAISISGQDSVCKGSTIKLTAIGATNYSWTPINDFQVLSSNSVSFAPLNDGKYNVVGKDLNDCINSTSFAITVIPKPAVSITGCSWVCTGQSCTLNATGADKYKWWSKTNSIYEDSSSIIAITPSSDATYYVVGTNSEFCKDSTSFSIIVKQLPEISIVAKDTVCANSEFMLSANGNGNFKWWSVNSINCSDCKIINVSINLATIFYASITDTNSCSTIDSVNIQIKNDCDFELIVPTIFSPNKDFINDFFKLRGKNVANVDCQIISRWGMVIKEFSGLEGFWDGKTSSGNECADGTYFYIVMAYDQLGLRHVYKGPLQLVR